MKYSERPLARVKEGFACIPRVRIVKDDEIKGECDLLVLKEQNSLAGFEVTIRENLDNKIQRLNEIREILNGRGYYFDYFIIRDRVDDLSDEIKTHARKLTEFDIKEILTEGY